LAASDREVKVQWLNKDFCFKYTGGGLGKDLSVRIGQVALKPSLERRRIIFGRGSKILQKGLLEKKKSGKEVRSVKGATEYINFDKSDFTIDTRQFEIYNGDQNFFIKCHGRNRETCLEIEERPLVIYDELVIGVGDSLDISEIFRFRTYNPESCSDSDTLVFPTRDRASPQTLGSSPANMKSTHGPLTAPSQSNKSTNPREVYFAGNMLALRTYKRRSIQTIQEDEAGSHSRVLDGRRGTLTGRADSPRNAW
jgi:hypothetical protein